MSAYRPIIGIEVHVEMRTNSKMFCGCANDHFGVEPNTHTCPVCLGLPGALPVANGEAIRRTIMIGLALGSEIAKQSKFDRKNYFYPDLPKGYQISQYDQPLCLGGAVPTSLGDVALERIHLEEDTAKLQHIHLTPEQMKTAKVDHADVSLIDFNRSGVPLVELVTKPVIHSAAQAREYAKNLVQILRYLGVSDCDMEKGSLRLEANISVQNEAEQAANKLPDYKVEVKNLNSFRFLERSIAYEIERHAKLRDAGELPVQETRGWNDAKGQTYSQRSKEDAADYRYFPDPDLPALELDDSLITELKEKLPELPQAKAERLIREFGVSAQAAAVLTAELETSVMAEHLLQSAKEAAVKPELVANAVVNKKVSTWLLTPEGKSAEELDTEIKRVVAEVITQSKVEEVPEARLLEIVANVVHDPANADAVAKYKAGKQNLLAFFVGQVARQFGGKIDFAKVSQLLQSELDK